MKAAAREFFHTSKKTLLSLLLILTLLLFMRLFHAEPNLGFGHDEDLGAWIAKDIIIDHNLRLIGQETSVGSVFIGPLFYYLQAFYFAAFNMDPIGGLYLTVTIAVLTLFSIFYVVRRFFNEKTALIAGLIYAGSQALAGHDSWIVPTQPTLLWTIWFLFALFHIIEQKNPKIIVLLGLLLGLIWYVHIAFIPLTALIFLAIFVSKKKTSLKDFFLNKYTLLGAGIFLVLMLPFFVFEIRHNFMQTNGLVNSVSEDRHQSEGRSFKVYDGVSWSFMNIIYEVRNTDQGRVRILQAVMLGVLILMLVSNTKSLGRKAWMIYGWLGIVVVSQLISKRAISEYYFTNLTIPWVLTIALFLTHFAKRKLIWLFAVLALCLFAGFNLHSALIRNPNPEGYLPRKKLVAFIARDAKAHNYPCISINYITSPGKNAGFRYFFWWNNLDLIRPGGDVAVYSILNPAIMAEDEIALKEGVLGVILPDNPKIDPAACTNPDRQLLPLWGFNN